MSYERTAIQPFPEGTLEYGRWCYVDGVPMACVQAWVFLQQSAIPEGLEDFQGQPGFSLENKGLGIFTATLPDIYVVHPGTPDAYPLFAPHGEKADGQLIFTGGTTIWNIYQATFQQQTAELSQYFNVVDAEVAGKALHFKNQNSAKDFLSSVLNNGNCKAKIEELINKFAEVTGVDALETDLGKLFGRITNQS